MASRFFFVDVEGILWRDDVLPLLFILMVICGYSVVIGGSFQRLFIFAYVAQANVSRSPTLRHLFLSFSVLCTKLHPVNIIEIRYILFKQIVFVLQNIIFFFYKIVKSSTI